MKAKTSKTATRALSEDNTGRAVPGDDAPAADTIAQMSRELPRASAPAAVAPTTPAAKVPGAGAFVFKKHSDQSGSYVFDPNAKTTETKLGLGHDLTALMFLVATNNGLDRLEFVNWCSENTVAVRAAAWKYREQGRQLAEFNTLVAAFKEASGGL